jgi:chromosome segregation ATPase
MSSLKVDLNSLCQLVEEEISAHHLLIEEMKREWECLRKGSADSLTEVVKKIEQHRETILSLQDRIQESIHKILDFHGKGGEIENNLTSLLMVLPPPYHEKVKSYQSTLRQLKGWVQKINDQNKLFIEEFLTYLRDVISWLVHPALESPGYIQTGREKTTVPFPRALDREV